MNRQPGRPEALEDVVNIGTGLAGDLRAAGIASPGQLRAMGALAAWNRLRQVSPERDCASSLLALEGAVRGVRWMAIEPSERERLGRVAAGLVRVLVGDCRERLWAGPRGWVTR